MSFVPLHTFSGFSFLESTLTAQQIVKLAKEQGYPAVALTDRNVLSGMVPFYEACQEEGVQPIIGVTVSVEVESAPFEAVFYAETNVGLTNLMKIASVVQTREEKLLPLSWAKGYAEGIRIVLPEAHLQTEDGQRQVESFLKVLDGTPIWGGVSGKPMSATDANPLFARLPKVAFPQIHYAQPEDRFSYEVLSLLKDGKTLQEVDADSLRQPDGKFAFPKSDDVVEQFNHSPGLLKETVRFVEECQVTLSLSERHLPTYPVPTGKSAAEMLQELAEEGLKRLILNPTKVYWDRLNHELDIIKKMGFSDYFLIVWDFMKYAREKGIRTGPGRGSAAGSLVSFALQITTVDPLEYDLLFERFLNPERISMPDIDIDFEDTRRDEVLKYVQQKYGALHVAQIATFGTFQPKAALRDCARVFNLSTNEQDRLSRLVPSKLGIMLAEVKMRKETAAWLEESTVHQLLFQTALTIEGLPRHASVHAAGVVLTSRPLTELVPIQMGSDGLYVTQLPMGDLEKLGLLKMDFLGLRNLTLLKDALNNVYKQTGTKLAIEAIDPHDAGTLKMLAEGKTMGIFQFESNGMQNVLRKLQPSRFEDLVAVNALYRPGPMEQIPQYVARKHGKENVSYWHKDVQAILEPTYGILVYQEQIMQIASAFAGFSLGEADLLRRAVSKKKKNILEEQRRWFVGGAISKGHEAATAEKIYDYIVRFSDYGFPKGHAVAYSRIAYELAYIKTHYPTAFMAAYITSVSGNIEKRNEALREAKQLGVQVKGPSISKSGYSFIVEGNTMHLPLLSIRGVGKEAVKSIINARKQHDIKDLFDFVLFTDTKSVNKGVLEHLVFAGAFDEWGEHRGELWHAIIPAIEYAQLVKAEEGELNLYGDEAAYLKPKYQRVDDFSPDQKLAREKEVLGLYVSAHPFETFAPYLKQRGCLLPADASSAKKRGRLGGWVQTIKTIRTKKGETMAFVTLVDDLAEVDVVVFPTTYRLVKEKLVEQTPLLIVGQTEERNGEIQWIAKEVYSQEEFLQQVYIRIPRLVEDTKGYRTLQNVLRRHVGVVPVILVYEKGKRIVRLSKDFYVTPSSSLEEDVSLVVGEENYVVQQVKQGRDCR